MTRLYICGQNGSGTPEDPYRPEIADEIPVRTRYSAMQEKLSSLPVRYASRFIVGLGPVEEFPAEWEFVDALLYERLVSEGVDEGDALMEAFDRAAYIAAVDIWHEEEPARVEARHAGLAYSEDNPLGFDWIEDDDGTVTLHAAP